MLLQEWEVLERGTLLRGEIYKDTSGYKRGNAWKDTLLQGGNLEGSTLRPVGGRHGIRHATTNGEDIWKEAHIYKERDPWKEESFYKGERGTTVKRHAASRKGDTLVQGGRTFARRNAAGG